MGLSRCAAAEVVEHPSVIPELDLVQEEDQITHLLSLSDDFDTEDMLSEWDTLAVSVFC